MKHETSPQDAINRPVYHQAHVDRVYRHTGLDNAEAMALLAYQQSFSGRDVLDLGIGTGRTTRYVAPLAGRYVGVDYSPVMVDHVGRNLPDIDVRLLDMRDLGDFATDSFDCVLALCNLLDAVSHEDRLKTLSEIHRVLRGGGVLIFSSHNRRHRFAGSAPRLDISRNPVTQLRNLLLHARRLRRFGRLRRYRREESDYALFSDIGHDFGMLHYYIDRSTQARQLEEAGFALVEAFARDGRRLGAGEDDSDTGDILYVARTSSPTATSSPYGTP